MINFSKPKFARPLTPNKLVVSVQPTNTTSSVALAPQPVVQIQYLNNTIVAGYTGSVTVSIVSGSGTLSGTTTINAVAGVASFTNLSVVGSGICRLGFSATNINSVSSSAFYIISVGGSASSSGAVALAMVTQPANASSSFVMGTQPVVRAVDSASVVVTSYTGSITATLVSGSGVLSGSVTKVPSSGVATFTDLAITGEGPAMVAFSAPGLTPISSSLFTVATPDFVATRIDVVPPSLSLSTETSSAQVVGTVYNAENQALNEQVYFRSTDTTVISINKYTGLATYVSSGTSSIYGLTTDPTATHLSMLVQPSASVAPQVLPIQPKVVALDVMNLGDTGYTGSVTASLNIVSGSPVLAGNSASTFTNGTASFAGLVISGSGTWNLTFSAPTVTNVISANAVSVGTTINVVDNFNRADVTSSLGTTSDGKMTWVNRAGAFGITGSQAYPVVAVSSGIAAPFNLDSAYAVATLPLSANGTLQVTLPTRVGNQGFFFRIQDDSNYWAAFNNGNYIYVYKVVAGVKNTIISAQLSGNYPLSDGVKFIVDLTPTGFAVKTTLGASTVTEYTSADTDYNSAIVHGMAASNPTVCTFEDFSFTGA